MMSEKTTLNPKALSLQEAAKVLDVEVEWLEEDIAEGAPTNADGTINLIHYAAWLNANMKEGGADA